jgi:oxygen-dependent protoporphyrinogen oxidase
MSKDGPREVIVIGAGISGLAAALKLSEKGCAVRLLEADAEPGGSIRTVRRDGFLIEGGPESFLTEKREALEMCRHLGMQEQVIGTNREHRRSFILRAGKMYSTPEGFYLLGPARYWPFFRTGLLSWRGKLRALADLVLPRNDDAKDESLASFVRRRLGNELLTYLAQPLVAGIYTADAERLSLQATFPVFLEIERRWRSVILGLRKRSAARRAEQASGARYGLFATLQGGLGDLVAALAAALPAGALKCNEKVSSLRRAGAGWRVVSAGGAESETEAVLLAVPAHISAELLALTDGSLAKLLLATPYATSVTVNLGFRREQVAHPLNGFGFVVPAAEKRRLLACTFSSAKFAGRAPAGHVLLRAFLGGALQPDVEGMSESELEGLARAELSDILGLRGDPLCATVHRHPRSMPQYEVGHLERVGRITERVRALPGIALAGNAFTGIGLPDCIRGAEEAVNKLLADSRVVGTG